MSAARPPEGARSAAEGEGTAVSAAQTPATGLLHRLAARANGSAWTVRSDARLPFAAEGLEPAPTPAAQTPPTGPAPMLQPAAPRMVPRAQAEAVHTAVPPARMAASPTQQAPANASSADPQPKATRLRHSLAPLANDAPSAPLPPTTHATPTPQEAAASLAMPLAPAARPAQAPVFTQQRDPAPLLPTHTAAATAAMPASPAPYARSATWASSAQPAAREDTEVHIHIGRIEVTAVHEAPQAKPRARERAQPVSLQAYLATRKTT